MAQFEVYTDGNGQTHFREMRLEFDLHDFAPPSLPVEISQDFDVSSVKFLRAAPGWDENFHTTPVQQFAICVAGNMKITVSNDQSKDLNTGDVMLLSDLTGKGHRAVASEPEGAMLMMVALKAR